MEKQWAIMLPPEPKTTAKQRASFTSWKHPRLNGHLPHYVYILFSIKADHYYIGMAYNFANRLQDHLKGKCKSTRHADDWYRVALRKCDNYIDAAKLERHCQHYEVYTKAALLALSMADIHRLEPDSRYYAKLRQQWLDNEEKGSDKASIGTK